jgi:two-component system CheB/CheR fusion protein
VAPARLTRFFSKEDHGFRVTRELRAAIVFSVHDVVGDAPFSRLNLISCRNLLIYLRPEVQQRVLSQFHFALHDRGILFLRPAETVGNSSNHFEPVSQPQRIYRHIGRGRPGEAGSPPAAVRRRNCRGSGPRGHPTRPRVSVGELAQRLLLEAYAPASVLANRKHKGLFYFGSTDLYLKMPPACPVRTSGVGAGGAAVRRSGWRSTGRP